MNAPSSHLSVLLALLAHDLRNPLSAILTNVNFVKSTMRGPSSDVEEALDDSALSCATLGQVIGNLDVLARSLASASPTRQPLAIRQVAEETATRFRPHGALTRLRIEVGDDAVAPTLFVEPTLFGRALDNLVANAVQYSPADGEIRIECEESGDRGALVVVDEGPVVPAELREQALAANWQNQAKQRYEARYGRGVGLYCAAEAARIAGAQVEIGERGGLSTFVLAAALAPH
jgi:K+-sensing histidine kinase KdpD